MLTVGSTSEELLLSSQSDSLTMFNDLTMDDAIDTSKLGTCEVCASRPAIYTCPKCELKTCSLHCVNIHKKEVKCNGVRDRTRFIYLNEFTNLDLLSDYRFLEDVQRTVESCKRDKKKGFFKKHFTLSNNLYKLRRAVYGRRGQIKFLPQQFTKHRNNTSRLDYKADVIYWRIDWVFPGADKLTLSNNLVPDSDKLASALRRCLEGQDDNVVQDKLEYYRSLGTSGLRVLMKAEGKPGSKYYELDLTMNLKQNFVGKLIIEYPTLLVINKEHASPYQIIESDERFNVEIDEKLLKGEEIVNKLLREEEMEQSAENPGKNFLFCDSDDDDDDNL